MRLPTEFLQLPLTFDADALAAEIATLPETAWRAHPQGHAGNSALPLVARGGDPADDGVAGAMAPTPHLQRLPYLRQVLASFAAPLGRTRLMRLDGNAEATAHCDVNYYWQDRYRVHVPILTTPRVHFLCGDAQTNMRAGECWIFDTTLRHNVLNPEPTRRIHLVADTVGSARFAQLIAQARDPRMSAQNWNPRHVEHTAGAPATLAFERSNFPALMTPWELAARCDAVLALCEDTHAAASLRAALQPLLADWRAAWAHHGDTTDGRDACAALRDRARAALEPLRGAASHGDVDIVDWLDHAACHAALGAVEKTPAREPSTRLARPVFIISPPRSGSSLLFETLAKAPGLATIGGESHGVIEGIATLHPAQRGWESNRLTAAEAEKNIVAQLGARFAQAARDRDGRAPAGVFRLLEKTPKNALRVAFLAAAFPDARFIYLYRDPRETLASMLDAWQSQRFVTYADLPEWSGPPWSLLLVPGWRSLAGRPLAEIVARQWATTVEQALDDLTALAPQRWCVARYDRLVAQPQEEIARLCAFLELDYDRTLEVPLPPSRYTLSSPNPDKWKRHADAIKSVLPYFEPAAQRAREAFAHAPPITPPRRRAPTDARPEHGSAAAFGSRYSEAVPTILRELGVTLVASCYQADRIVLVRERADELNTHLRALRGPMGIALGRTRLAIGTHMHVHEFRNQPQALAKLPEGARHDACYLPQRAHVTGDIRLHEMAFDGDDTLWLVNTRFSCLCTLDARHSFVPRWRPAFVSALAPDDRCHLNGLAMEDGWPRLVSALGTGDSADAWRAAKFDGGVLIDVASGEIAARGLAMPHSPRRHAQRWWLLESARGELAQVDLYTGGRTTVATLPGFVRGLAFAGKYAFVGLSQVREAVFDGLPLLQRAAQRICGIWAVDTQSGAIVATLRFDGAIQEIFDVQILPQRFPEIAEPEADVCANAFVLPDAALAQLAPTP